MGDEQSKMKAEQMNKNRGSLRLGKCDPPKHVQAQYFCNRENCKNRICDNCFFDAGQPGKKYCMMCTIAIRNKDEGQVLESDEMDFEEANKDSANSFDVVKVRRDMKTGEIQGWQEFYDLVCMSDEDMSGDKATMDAKMKRAEEQMKKSQAQTYVVMDEQPFINKKIVMLKNLTTEETFEVAAVKNNRGVLTYQNMPPEIEVFMFNYSTNEIYDNFLEVMECLTTMHAAMGGGVNIADSTPQDAPQELPTTEEFKKNLNEHANFQTTDPSAFYDITSKYKLGIGGFAKVFKVQRKADGLVCALKFVEPKDNREKMLMYNEVALMNMSKGTDFVLEVYESFDYRNRLWIFVELMDFALTPIIEVMQNTYTENCCKYILMQTLLGLKFLHDKHIVHRDIKSDNILADSNGEVKLADFGYSAQLTQERDARSSKVGTVCWMAPELIKGERRYDQKVDIWSFGIFAMELTNGDPPYINEPQSRVIINIVMNQAPAIKDKWSSTFQDFVAKCLTKDPRKRPSADELLEHDFLIGAADHKQEFAQIVKNYCVIHAEKKKKQKQ